MFTFVRKATKVLLLWALQCYSWVLARYGFKKRTKLELGSGPVRKAGWVTLDLCLGPDLTWDLRRNLPFRSNRFEWVYCSHVLEHFAFRDLKALLREIHRILKPGGEFWICVPDASLYVEAYLGLRDGADLLRYKPAVISMEKMDLLNYIFYMDGHHHFMFDSKNLEYHCKMAGFVDCRRRSFDPSVDLIERDYESLYFVCRKPARKVKP